MVPLGGAAVMLAAWLLVRVMIVGSAAGFADDPHAWWQPGDGTTSRILAVPLILAFYLRRILFPWWLAFESGIEPVRHAADPQIWIAAGGAVLLLVLAYRIRRREPAVAFGVGWFLLTLLPVLNIFPIFESAMEHFAYLPSVGLIVAAVAVGRTIISSPRPAPGTVRVAVCVVLVALLGARAMARNADWRDEETFWRATVRDSPSARAWNNLGLLLRESGRTDEAALALNEVRRRRPDLPSSHTNLGVIAAARGGRDAAISLFRQALSIDPHNADALYNLALLLEENERGQRYGPGFPAGEALSTYTRLVETHPAHAEGWTNLGVLHERLRNPEEARAAYGAAIRAAPHLPEPHVFLAAHLWEMGERQRAAALYRRYLELAPTGPFASEAHSRSQP
jgi:tetratricopeptide (TPR) repeat protein